ncbi:hypothetical protein CYY_009949 [Polysphondylium violaceum]|uniref:WD40 repeat-containing protein SMU1 n=1 Tax=Polysphondylium violaceum TaxID=133409 RepID=A0A8J4UUX5_9MYCE|nr:hypothetical protein CYY_009949 [Polysphondylium violaceum]
METDKVKTETTPTTPTPPTPTTSTTTSTSTSTTNINNSTTINNSNNSNNNNEDEQENILTTRQIEIKNIVSSAEYSGPPKKTIYLEDNEIFDPNDPQIKEDIIRMIIQYLQDEGYTSSLLTVQDEANVKFSEHVYKISQMKKMKKAILEGDWNEVEKLCSKNTFKNHQSFLYAVYKQAYLELLEKQEYQKAFSYLTKRLKPLEGRQNNADEFKDLCYLLTCRSVQEVSSFKNWDGSKGTSREKLVEQFQSMLELENTKSTGALFRVPPHRLISLLKQSVTYQIEFGRYHPKVMPKIKTLLDDYSCFVLPNSLKFNCVGHKKNVKCVEFIGNGLTLASGSSDNTIKLWNSENGSLISTITGNGSRIWDLSSSHSGSHLASASGDGVVKIWDIQSPSKPLNPFSTKAHEGDAYTVQFHPGQNHIVTGGYDKMVHLYDARTGVLVKSFSGHNGSISKVIFNPHGNLIISGSKDSTIKFWDIVSGVCIKTLSSHLGEVTSIATNSSGSHLLSASKDNSNRLWDIRSARPIKRFKGHQNTSKNFVRSSFGPNESLIIGGSEDGYVYIWDIETCNILQKLGSPSNHMPMVYSATWSQEQSILASCSQDSSVKLWWYDPAKPVFTEN